MQNAVAVITQTPQLPPPILSLPSGEQNLKGHGDTLLLLSPDSELCLGWYVCCVLGEAGVSTISIPHEHQFNFQLLYLKAEDGSRIWAMLTYLGDPSGVAGSWLWHRPTLVTAEICLFLSNLTFQVKEITLKNNRKRIMSIHL